jgi:cytochrome c551/c552
MKIKLITICTSLIIFVFASCTNESSSSNTNNQSSNASEQHTEGKALFQLYCASCHSPSMDGTGPALKGVLAKLPNKEWLYNWIKNPQNLIDANDKYALEISKKWAPATMTSFPNLSKEQIDEIMAWVEE